MSIVTKTGDTGETSLMYGRRVSKADAQVEAYGSVDELSAALGAARAFADDPAMKEQIVFLQKDLITVMGELATAAEDLERYRKDGFSLTTAEMVDRITQAIETLESDKSLYKKGWAIPGETNLAAALDFARTLCRRAERRVVASGRDKNPQLIRYLNRLSDFCWLLARVAEKSAQKK